MAILNPEHLFEQAEKLIVPPPAGPPRQVDIRRAISAAYYGVFHAVSAAAADQFIGVTQRNKSEYGLVYRAFDHRWLRELCDDVRKSSPPPRYASHIPATGFRDGIVAFAAAVVDLQQKRHNADYDPMVRMKTSDAISAINTARAAVRRFAAASTTSRKAFLSLLLFPPPRR